MKEQTKNIKLHKISIITLNVNKDTSLKTWITILSIRHSLWVKWYRQVENKRKQMYISHRH